MLRYRCDDSSFFRAFRSQRGAVIVLSNFRSLFHKINTVLLSTGSFATEVLVGFTEKTSNTKTRHFPSQKPLFDWKGSLRGSIAQLHKSNNVPVCRGKQVSHTIQYTHTIVQYVFSVPVKSIIGSVGVFCRCTERHWMHDLHTGKHHCQYPKGWSHGSILGLSSGKEHSLRYNNLDVPFGSGVWRCCCRALHRTRWREELWRFRNLRYLSDLATSGYWWHYPTLQGCTHLPCPSPTLRGRHNAPGHSGRHESLYTSPSTDRQPWP